MGKYNNLFFKRFGIRSSFTYLPELVVCKEDLTAFTRAWKKKYHARLNKDLSPTRKKQFDRFFKKLDKLGDDALFCEKIKIKHIDKHIGYGVFAKEDIPPYAILNQYTGVIRKDTKQDDANDSVFAISCLDHFSIDGKEQGNWTRFMNHSCENPNVAVWEYFRPDGPRIVFTAGSKGIKKGEELLYSYGEDYWVEEVDYSHG